MAVLVYVDETGSSGKGANSQPQLILVAAMVREDHVQSLGKRLDEIGMANLGWLPARFEFHGSELWGGSRHWASKGPDVLLRTYEAAIALLDELEIELSHSTINKSALHAKYDGASDENVYRLALQFLLEKVDKLDSEHKIVIADEAKAEQLKAVRMVSEMQDWGGGEVLGRRLKSIIDSLHFVRSCDSPGVQMADLVAYLIQRHRRGLSNHHLAQEALERMISVINNRTHTWREAWP